MRKVLHFATLHVLDIRESECLSELVEALALTACVWQPMRMRGSEKQAATRDGFRPVGSYVAAEPKSHGTNGVPWLPAYRFH